MEVTRELVEDVAAELGINEPSLVEKDFHVVRALSLLADYRSSCFELVFAGGTCLSKVFAGLQRMSEDVDLKVLLTEEGRELSKSARRRELSALKSEVYQLFEQSGFVISAQSARNENRFIGFELAYAAIFDVIDALRPNIKIELALCDYECRREVRTITSLIGQVMGEVPEIEAFACIGVVHTAAEKLVSLLRRTSAGLRGIDDWADDALIRHIYDLHVIDGEIALGAEFVQLVHQTVAADAEQFGNKHKEFLDDAVSELRAALAALASQAIYREQYSRFLGPLVYAQSKPDFDQGLATINKLSALVWGEDIHDKDVGAWMISVRKLADGKYQGIATRKDANKTITKIYGWASKDEKGARDRTLRIASKYAG